MFLFLDHHLTIVICRKNGGRSDDKLILYILRLIMINPFTAISTVGGAYISSLCIIVKYYHYLIHFGRNNTISFLMNYVKIVPLYIA